MARIFLTGASGYIGGDVLYALKSAHPEYECSVLLRDASKAATLSKAYPDVRVVQGDLDSGAVIEEEARRADVVVNAASSSHINAVEAIARGMQNRNTTPGHWIQVSGATVLSIPDIASGTYGEKSDKVYSDVDGADEVRQLIQQNSAKRVVDNKLLNLTGPKTALVFPPIIYGQGRGPIKQRSVQIPELARAAIQNRKAIQVGKGESAWSNVHISDISDIFVKLVEKAVQGAEDSRLWNRNGLYFAGNAMLDFKGISQLIAKAAHSQGLTEDTAVIEISHEEADNVSGHAGILWGTNARQISQRARQLLGWAPKGIALDEEIPYTVRTEAARL